MRSILLSVVPLLLLTACASSEAKVKQAIAEANYCETAEDCELVGSKCPFDCYIYANAKEADRIRTMVNEFPSQCEYACVASYGVQCIEHVCHAILEPLPPPENPEGNPGASCTTDAECVTPVDYLVRSSCPFGSKCIEGTCSVVCPMWAHDMDPGTSQSHAVKCSADSDCDCQQFPGGAPGDCRCVENECMAVMTK